MTLDQALGGLANEHRDELSEETISVLTWKISRLNEQIDGLKRAVESRGMIGQAIGLTMSRYGVDSDTAFAFLVRLSQDSNTKLRDVCATIVADANRSAQAQ
jgi:AmiR/NasT family two-component response regulator